ncbi:MAG: exosortase/archaeosortase family protein [Gemmataceae bacterium]
MAVAVALLAALALWAYWPTLSDMASRWTCDPQYSHGYLVPVFSLVLLWLRSNRMAEIRWQFRAGGLGWFAAALTIRYLNLVTYNLDWLDAASLVLSVFGIVALAGGCQALKWAWPAVGFLMFMVPLPYRVERMLGGPLQPVATQCSTFLLQMLGFPAAAEGNVILLRDLKLGVAEACSGLSMLLVFFALAVAFAAVLRRPLLDRGILVASALPIAVVVNVIRITVTGMLHVWVGTRIADLVFHDLAGWLMMPLALGLLWLEQRFLTYVLVEASPDPDPNRRAFEKTGIGVSTVWRPWRLAQPPRDE